MIGSEERYSVTHDDRAIGRLPDWSGQPRPSNMLSNNMKMHMLLRMQTLLALTVLLAVINEGHAYSTDGPLVNNLTETEKRYVQMYWDYKASEHIPPRAVPGSIGPQLDYRFVTPRIERSAGVTYVGHAARLRLVLERARRGEALRVAVLGGSITYGQGVGGQDRTYPRIFMDWLNEALPSQQQQAQPQAQWPKQPSETEPQGDGTPTQTTQEGERQRFTAAARPDIAAGDDAAAAAEVGRQGGLSESQRLLLSNRSPVLSSRLHLMSRHVHVVSSGSADGGGGDAGREGSGALLRSNISISSSSNSNSNTSTSSSSRSTNSSSSTSSSSRSTNSSSSTSSSRSSRSSSGSRNNSGSSDVGGGGVGKSGAIRSSSPRRDTVAMARRGRALRGNPGGGSYSAGGERQGAQQGRPQGGGPVQRVEHVFLNGAVPGTKSSYTSSCLYHHLIPSPDLVLVEFAVNDPPFANWAKITDAAVARRPFERLIRKLLQLPSHPAVVLVNMFATGPSAGHYWQTAERDFGEFATYYGLPSVSLKAALLPSAYTGSAPEHMALPAIFNGGLNHPGRGGHVIVAELLISLCLGLLRSDAHTYPTEAVDEAGGGGAVTGTAAAEDAAAVGAQLGVLEAVAARPLPPPIFLGNYGTLENLCFIGNELTSLVVHPVEGWAWTDEGRGKWGYVTTQPGQSLQIKVNTRMAGHPHPHPNPQQPHPPNQGNGTDYDSAMNEPVILQVGYLQSYRGMGTARIRCVRGCKCRPEVIDAYDHAHRVVSLTNMHDFQVTQHPECVLQLTSGPPSQAAVAANEGGHKFKLMGIVVGEDPGAQTGGVTFYRDMSYELSQLALKKQKRIPRMS